jgi:tetratricopeptide (TPR) repeat protein
MPAPDVGEVTREIDVPNTPLSKKKSPSPSGDEIIGTAQPTSVEELRLKANLYFVKGDWVRTARTLEQLVRREPSAGSYFLLGMTYSMGQKFLAAAGALEEAAKLRPGHFITQFNLGSAYLMHYIHTGDNSVLKRAVQPFKKTIEIGERQGQAALSLGFIYDMLGDWRRAEKYYLKAAELSDEPSSAYQNLARLYMNMGDDQPARREHYYLKAADAFRKALETAPNMSDVYNFLGHAYAAIGKTELALQAFERALEFDDNNLLALANLVSAYLDAKRYEEAQDASRRIIRMNVQTVRTYITRKLGRPLADAELFRSDAYVGYGVAYMELYRVRAEAAYGEDADTPDLALLREAEKAFKKAIEIHHENGNALYDLAVLYYRQNRLEEAREAVRQLLATDPENETLKDIVRRLLEEQLQQRLLARGILREVREPVTDLRPYRNRKMMTVRSKPLSQLAIEGRR